MTLAPDDIRILLVDDHMVVRKGLMHVLDTVEGFTVVGEAENGEEALYLCRKLKPCVVVMDVKMEGMGGVETTRLILKHYPAIRIVGLSTAANRDAVEAMLAAGASGYLLKDVSAPDLVDAVRRIHIGERLAPPEFIELAKLDNTRASVADLSEAAVAMGGQQRKVLALMTKGLTNAEIAAHLGVSQPTARYHVSAILKKLDVSNRAEAAALATRANLICDEGF